ncbi:MAG: electron transfer flavoprotein subunit beta/FixA family protein [Acidimicrobiales bacterium]
MRAVVCVKQVGVLSDEVELRADGLDVDPDYLERSLNEWDACALEEALLLADACPEGGEVLAVTAGGEEADAVLRRCLAMGAHRARRVELDASSPDPLTVAQSLAAALAKEEPDLVLCGVQSSDSVQAATGTMLAELLGIARVAVVTEITLADGGGRATVHRELEGGLVDIVEVDLPALLTIQTGINEPRYATLRAIKQANLKEIDVIAAPSGGEGCYRIEKMFVPDRGGGAELLGSGAVEVARRVAELVAARLS